MMEPGDHRQRSVTPYTLRHGTTWSTLKVDDVGSGLDTALLFVDIQLKLRRADFPHCFFAVRRRRRGLQGLLNRGFP